MATTAAELRAEAARMREFALSVTDPEVLAEIHAMIEEWERRARQQDNGGHRGAELIARNRLLLTRAAETRAWSGEAQQRANETVQTMMATRLAWARVRQRRDDPSSPPALPPVRRPAAVGYPGPAGRWLIGRTC